MTGVAMFLPPRPVLTLGLASIARAPSASPSAAAAATSAALGLVTLITLAAAEAHSRRPGRTYSHREGVR
jgi:hypothetical protein